MQRQDGEVKGGRTCQGRLRSYCDIPERGPGVAREVARDEYIHEAFEKVNWTGLDALGRDVKKRKVLGCPLAADLQNRWTVTPSTDTANTGKGRWAGLWKVSFGHPEFEVIFEDVCSVLLEPQGREKGLELGA